MVHSETRPASQEKQSISCCSNGENKLHTVYLQIYLTETISSHVKYDYNV